jgi:hypothetical protein
MISSLDKVLHLINAVTTASTTSGFSRMRRGARSCPVALQPRDKLDLRLVRVLRHDGEPPIVDAARDRVVDEPLDRLAPRWVMSTDPRPRDYLSLPPEQPSGEQRDEARAQIDGPESVSRAAGSINRRSIGQDDVTAAVAEASGFDHGWDTVRR